MLKQYLELPRPVHILCLGTFINRAGTMVIPFLTIYLQKELGLGVAFAANAMGAYGFGAIFAAVIGGHLADRVGRRVVLMFSLFGTAGVLLAFGWLTEPWTIVAACFAFGLIAEMYRPAASAMIGDLVEKEQRTHAFGLMYVSINLGFSVAPLIGGMLATYSYHWLFRGDALTTAVYGIIIFIFIRETLPGHRGDMSSSLDRRTEDEKLESDESSASLADAMLHIARDRTFLTFCLATLCVAAVMMQVMSTFPLYLQEHGINVRTYGKIIALNGIMIVFLQLPITAMISRFHRGNVLIAGAILTGVGFGLFGLAGAVWQFCVGVAVLTFGEMMLAPVAPAVVTDLAPTHLRARYMGVFSTCFSSAVMIGVPIGGHVFSHWGGRSVWAACLGMGLLAAFLYLMVRRRVGAASESSS